MESQISRRSVLIGASAGAGGLVLAACSSSGQEHKADAGAPGTTGSSSVPSETGQAQSTAASTAKTSAASAPKSAAGESLASLSDIPVGGAVSATGAANAKLLISQPTKGKVVAFSSICTHEGCTVIPGKGTLDCHCHGSVFNLATGVPMHGPATKPLASVKVDVVDGKVVEAS